MLTGKKFGWSKINRVKMLEKRWSDCVTHKANYVEIFQKNCCFIGYPASFLAGVLYVVVMK